MNYKTGIKLKNLHVRRGDRLLIKDLSLSLSPGQSLLLTGPNGSGKTSLLKACSGFLALDEGTIEFQTDGEGAVSFPQVLCHYIGHGNGLRSNLSLQENLHFWIDFYEGTKAHKEALSVQEILEKFALDEIKDLPVGYLSAGQKRRGALARLLLIQRPVWILDEPTVSLDKTAVELFSTHMRTHLESQGIILASSHIDLKIDFTKNLRLGREAKVAQAS